MLWTIRISIHALREERDCLQQEHGSASSTFQSTRSARSATSLCQIPGEGDGQFQSTRSARSATPGWPRGRVCSCNFNPRAPRGARLSPADRQVGLVEISIHALREERDAFAMCASLLVDGISIHALREERDQLVALLFCIHIVISIHALREERDPIHSGGTSL